jgi:hypothetical protein
MPLRFKAQGRWADQPFSAEGRTGDVLYLSAPLQNPFPAEVQLVAGATRLRANGAIASLATLDGANVDFQVQGNNLADLHKLVGVVLPDTPRYALAGQLSKQGEVWRVRASTAGWDAPTSRRTRVRPVGQGALAERAAALAHAGFRGPRAGDRPEGQAPAKGTQVAAAPKPADAKGKKAPKDPNRKVLPTPPST